MSDQNNPKKDESTLDKIVMGAIIGTAIGSALGASMAPKPGKETREIVGKAAQGFWSKLKGWMGKEKTSENKESQAASMKEIPVETDALHE